jgi:hypothetical protein
METLVTFPLLLAADKDFKFSESDFAMADDISVSNWKDHGSKAVLISNNMHNPEERTFVSRRNKEGKKEDVSCPQSVAYYNRFMGGVDKFDQYHSSYNILWKSRRWWVQFLYYLIDAAIVNLYALYKETNALASRNKAVSILLSEVH